MTVQHGSCPRCHNCQPLGTRCWRGCDAVAGAFIETLTRASIQRLRTAQNLREAGQTYQAIGATLGVSGARAEQIVKRAQRIAVARDRDGLPWREYEGVPV